MRALRGAAGAGMSFAGRLDVGANERSFVFRSPCCGMDEVVSAYAVAAAQRWGVKLKLQCGRTAADPLRPVVPGLSRGCGQWFEEGVGGA